MMMMMMIMMMMMMMITDFFTNSSLHLAQNYKVRADIQLFIFFMRLHRNFMKHSLKGAYSSEADNTCRTADLCGLQYFFHMPNPGIKSEA